MPKWEVIKVLILDTSHANCICTTIWCILIPSYESGSSDKHCFSITKWMSIHLTRKKHRCIYRKQLSVGREISCTSLVIWESAKRYKKIMNSMKLVIPLHFISWKRTPNDAVTPQRQSQFTPKMKASAFAFIFGVNWSVQCYGMTSFMEFMV